MYEINLGYSQGCTVDFHCFRHLAISKQIIFGWQKTAPRSCLRTRSSQLAIHHLRVNAHTRMS